MVRSHEIRDRIHVSEQSMDFGGLARWSASHWDKWIFKKKTDVDGNVTVYEARLVAKSFSQVQGVDYDEIFSSVAMLKSVGIMLALAAFMKSGRWMSKQVSLPVFVRKGCMWYNQKGFVDPKDAKRYASSSDPSKDWSEHLGVGMYALMMIKDFGFIQSLWETCISKEVSGSTIEFLMSICCWHIVDQKWCRISGKHIGLFEKCFSMENLD